ncbi:multidrug effflux MFS transporter [Salinarimonas soli]|uniref:Bcr/CflA family efflux transporter n=1 Tax=Salinarimonas soli TaxID=1638099 RepID=A0A5B2V4P9_9HYPH|nr:multidrug effflux MFS transporter [Salinarimonas soli]KAA2233442.1 multidrug effflux MFS transporter [Salinarimonas soli]
MRLQPDTLAMTAVLALLTALAPLSTDMYLPSLPAIAGELRATTGGAQLTLSAFLVGFAVGQFLYGPLSDKLGRRPVLLAGLVLFAAATVACTFAPSIETLVGARFVQALGGSAPVVLARAVVRDLYEGPRAGRELSRMGTIMGLVPAAAPVLGGLIHEAFGWRATFAAIFAFALAMLAVVSLALPETVRVRQPGPISFLGILRGFRELLRHRAFRVYVGLNALTYAGLFAFISGSSFVLQGVYGLDRLPYAFSFAFMVFGFIGGTLVAQRLVGGRGLDGVIALGVACQGGAGLAMIALALAGTGTSLELTLPMTVYAAGVGLTMPQSLAAAMTPFANWAGAASSLLGICQMTFAAVVGVGLGAGIGVAPLLLPGTIALLGVLAFLLFHASRAARSGA